MAKKVILELNETQARTLLAAVEEWFRLRMGQGRDLADGLAFTGYQYDKNDPENRRIFDERILRRDVINELIRAMFRVAWPNGYGTPQEIEPEVHVASDIWSTLRYELSDKDAVWDRSPFQMGPEPLPKITVEEMQ